MNGGRKDFFASSWMFFSRPAAVTSLVWQFSLAHASLSQVCADEIDNSIARVTLSPLGTTALSNRGCERSHLRNGLKLCRSQA